MKAALKRFLRWEGLPLVLALGDLIAWAAIGVIWWKALS